MKVLDISSFQKLNTLNYQLAEVVEGKQEEDSTMLILFARRHCDTPFHQYENFSGFYKPCVRILSKDNI